MTSGGSDSPSLPRHVAIIMDGNGRWAKLRGLPRVEGHRMGVRAVRAVVECARELRISCLTLYAFSLENWGRPEPEVRTLMTLLQEFLVSELPLLLRHRIRLRVIGETSSLPFAVRQVLGRTVSAEAAGGKSAPGEITEEIFSSRLDTAAIPDPDLVIRTSGEIRLSNFLLWQSAYPQFPFTDVLGPDSRKAGVLQ